MSVLKSLESPDNYEGFNQYFVSKLLMTIFCAKMAELVSLVLGQESHGSFTDWRVRA